MISKKSKNLVRKVDGQMIILAGFFVGIAIVALTILLNQIILSGHQVSKTQLDNSKYDLSSLRAETIRAIRRAAYDSWKINTNGNNDVANLTDVNTNFTIYMDNYQAQIPRIYSQYGKIVNVSNFNILSNDSESYIDNVSFEMSYTDGVNSYYGNVSLEHIRLTTGVYGDEVGSKERRALLAFLDPMNIDSSGAKTNLTVRITNEVGNPIPNGYSIPINFTLWCEPNDDGDCSDLNADVKHGYLIYNGVPYYDSIPNVIADGNGLINMVFVHKDVKLNSSGSWVADSRTHAGKHAILIESQGVPSVLVPVADVKASLTAPNVFVGPDQSISEGSSFSQSGWFTDPDLENWNATVNYGDGSGDQILTLSGQTFSLNHVYTDNGTYTVTVTVTGELGSSGSDNVIVTVNNVAPAVEAGPGATISLGDLFSSSGSFSDPGADTWSATVDYGDGSGVQSLVLVGNTFSLSHTYSDSGMYIVTVTVTDDDGGTGTDTATVNVNNVPPAVDAGSNATINEGGAFSSSGSFTDPDSSTWTATVDYGDGSPVQPLVLVGKTFSLNHTYADNGVYTVTVTVTDDDGGIGTDTATVSVNNVAPTLAISGANSVDEASVYTLSLSSSDPGADTITGWQINWGDGSVDTVGGNPASVTHTYADGPISYTISANATDEDGTFDANTKAVNVNNVAPTLTILGLDSVSAGSVYTLSLSSSDPGVDTITNWVIDWGDGTVDPIAGNPASVDHTYSVGGIYTISANATDEDGTFNANTKAVTVI